MDTPQNHQISSSNLSCRQSSARWTPTSEQIRILKELYYTNGVRSPTADQIQRISAKLKQYGKIEGKNVFYWFQNHKARERQKKRFTSTTATSPPPPPCRKYCQDVPFPPPPAGFSSSSTSLPHLLNVGPVSGGYGSVAMEKSFRDCSISPADPYFPSGGYYQFLEKRKYVDHETPEDDEQQLQEEEEEEEDDETLPLFPIQSEQMTLKQETYDFNNGCQHGIRAEDDFMASSRASLELTLSSYSAKRLN